MRMTSVKRKPNRTKRTKRITIKKEEDERQEEAKRKQWKSESAGTDGWREEKREKKGGKRKKKNNKRWNVANRSFPERRLARITTGTTRL